MSADPTSVRIPDPLKTTLRRAAKQEHRSLAAQIIYVLTNWAAWWQKQNEKK